MVNHASVGILRRLTGPTCRIPEDIVMAAVVRRNLPVLRWAKDHGSEITSPVLLNAAGSGNVELLDWLEAEAESLKQLRAP